MERLREQKTESAILNFFHPFVLQRNKSRLKGVFAD
jgi:hypothetical protein